MEINKIIVWTSPTSLFQKIFVMKEGTMIDKMGVQINDLEETLFSLVDKYEIYQIDFSGTQSFAKGIGDKLNNNQITKYNCTKISINYV